MEEPKTLKFGKREILEFQIEVPNEACKGCCKFHCVNYPTILVDKRTKKPWRDEKGGLQRFHNNVCLLCKFFKPFNFCMGKDLK